MRAWEQRRFCTKHFSKAVMMVLSFTIFAFLSNASGFAAPLTTLEYRVSGTSLQVSPPALAVPKGIPGSVLVAVISGGSTNNPVGEQLAAGAYVEAILRGLGFSEPRRLVGPPNAPLLLSVT